MEVNLLGLQETRVARTSFAKPRLSPPTPCARCPETPPTALASMQCIKKTATTRSSPSVLAPARKRLDCSSSPCLCRFPWHFQPGLRPCGHGHAREAAVLALVHGLVALCWCLAHCRPRKKNLNQKRSRLVRVVRDRCSRLSSHEYIL